jgi:transposase
MANKVAGIDVHKKVLVAVIADEAQPDVPLVSRRFGAGAAELGHLLAWLCHYGVVEAVMESTAQYWKPVWMELEPHMRLHLAQAQSNKAPKGRKTDLADAKRLVRRFVAGELILSFIPEPEQRSWRMVTRGRLQLVRSRVRLQNQIESLLEEGRIKLSSVISDLLPTGADLRSALSRIRSAFRLARGQVSGRRILHAMANGETNPEILAKLGEDNLKCGVRALVDALTGSMGDIHRKLLRQKLDQIEMLDRQIEELNKMAASELRVYQDGVTRLIEIPGIGAEAAQEIVAEIGPEAAAFASPQQLASWIGVCPGSNESAGQNHSGKSPKGSRFMRRLLNQAAQAAVRTEGSHLQAIFKRLVVRLGYVKAIWAIAHRLCKIIWNILHKGARFTEFSVTRNPKAVRRAIAHHLKALRRLGYDIPPATAIPLQARG